EPGAVGATSLNPQAQQSMGGLVRQEVPRAARHFAEQNGGSDILDSGQALIAPEIVKVEFHYFNGGEVFSEWDMKEQQALPAAIEVCIWLRSASAASRPIGSQNDAAGLANSSRQYRQVVYLPMAQVMSSGQSGGSSSSSSSDSTGTSSSDA